MGCFDRHPRAPGRFGHDQGGLGRVREGWRGPEEGGEDQVGVENAGVR